MSKSIQNYISRRVLWRRLQSETNPKDPIFDRPLEEVFPPKDSLEIVDVPEPTNQHFVEPVLYEEYSI